MKAAFSTSSDANDDESPIGGERVEYVQALERGINVIKAFSADRPKLTLAEVARHTGLARGAARRFLMTLRTLGYIGTDGKYFYLLPNTLEIGYTYLASIPWWKSAQQLAEELSKEVGISVAVGVLDNDTVLYVAYGRPDEFSISGRTIGTRLPVYASAIGRVLLAYATPPEIATYFDTAKLAPITPMTETNLDRLKAALSNTAKNGYALIDQELALGLKTMAVPVFNRSGTVVAAIGLDLSSLPGTTESLIQTILPKLRAISLRITESFPV